MRFSKVALPALLIVIFTLVACEGIQIKRVAPSAPVAFATYAWDRSPLVAVPGAASAQLVELDSELRRALGRLMAARGYRLSADEQRADMVLGYGVAIAVEEAVEDQTPSGWDSQFDINAVDERTILPSGIGVPSVTLMVSLGRRGGPALWGGSATKLIAGSTPQPERQRIVSEAVNELLSNLPPAP